MAIIRDAPLICCSRCGRPIQMVYVETYRPDPTGKLLAESVEVARGAGLCLDCRMSREYYIREGREEDWNNGRP